MISKRGTMILRSLYRRSTWNCRFSSSTSLKSETNRDPAPLFFNDDVQSLLKTLTRVDYQKVFRVRKDGKKLEPPQYKFMTDEELQEAMDMAKQKANKRLQMPPVVKVRVNTSKILSSDPALQGFDSCKYMFTDISFDISNRKRLIVVREPNGILRHALWSERDRLNQIYFPMGGREIHKPKMFEGEYLMNLLEQGEYEFIMDRACVQFEPDDPEFHEVAKNVYSHINMTKKFDYLRSTRHFGPMAFHFAWNNEIDNLLIDIIQNKRLDEAGLLIKLYHKIQPTADSFVENYEKYDAAGLIRRYAELDSVRRGSVERALLAYEELETEKKKVEQGIKKAHGLDDVTDETQT